MTKTEAEVLIQSIADELERREWANDTEVTRIVIEDDHIAVYGPGRLEILKDFQEAGVEIVHHH